MIPVQLEISGFLSYQDPVTLDFSPFHLACITGGNGAGKSSLLDAMTWALFGEARKRDDSLINLRSPDGARVMFTFEYEGNEYRIVRAKASGRSASLEFYSRLPQGTWHALTEHSLRATQECIQNTIRMDYETFTHASFFLQGKADQFTQQNASKRKQILSSILGLDIWEAYLETTRKRRRSVETDVARLDGRLSTIDEELREEPDRLAAMERLQRELSEVQARKEAQSKTLASIQKIAAIYEEQQALVATQQARVLDAEARLENRMQALANSQAEAETHRRELEQAQQIELEFNRLVEVRAGLEELGSLAQRFHEAEKRRAAPLAKIAAEQARLEEELRSLDQQALRVEEWVDQMTTYQSEIERAELILADTTREVEQKSALEAQKQVISDHMAELKADNGRLKSEMDQIKLRITRLEESTGSTCPLCGQPLNEADRLRLILELQDEGKNKADRYRGNQAKLVERQNELQGIDVRLGSIRAAENRLKEHIRQRDQVVHQMNTCQMNISAWEKDGKPRQAVLRAQLSGQQFAQGARQQLAEIDDQLRAMGYDPQAHEALQREEQSLRGSEERLRNLERSRAALGPLERQITNLQADIASMMQAAEKETSDLEKLETRLKEMAETLPDLAAAEEELRMTREEESRKTSELGAARARVEVLKDLKRDREALIGERTALQTVIARLKKLERAFGKDGIPALLIEQALPQIETQANEILDRLSGGSMSVRFATQKDYKDKNREDKKETLDIQISDAYGTRDYEMFSGGEAFRINFALRLALSRVLSQRAGARLQTLVIDEGFGSQDVEGRQRLVEAISQVQSEFKKILVITHLDELKDQFPARIEVEKTPRGSRVSVAA